MSQLKKTKLKPPPSPATIAMFSACLSDDNVEEFFEALRLAGCSAFGSDMAAYFPRHQKAQTPMHGAMSMDAPLIFDALLALVPEPKINIALDRAALYCASHGGFRCLAAILARRPLAALAKDSGAPAFLASCSRRDARVFNAMFDAVAELPARAGISPEELAVIVKRSAQELLGDQQSGSAVARRINRLRQLGLDWSSPLSDSGHGIFWARAERSVLASDEICLALLAAGASPSYPSAPGISLAEALFSPDAKYVGSHPQTIRWMLENLSEPELLSIMEPLASSPKLADRAATPALGAGIGLAALIIARHLSMTERSALLACAPEISRSPSRRPFL